MYMFQVWLLCPNISIMCNTYPGHNEGSVWQKYTGEHVVPMCVYAQVLLCVFNKPLNMNTHAGWYLL